MLASEAPAGLSDVGLDDGSSRRVDGQYGGQLKPCPLLLRLCSHWSLFPLLDIASIQDTAAPYANKVIFLFLGGFIVAFAMQRWDLHRRIALNVLQVAGGNGRSLVGGFHAFQCASKHVGNEYIDHHDAFADCGFDHHRHSCDGSRPQRKDSRDDFQSALLLGVAYGATIGGMATLVGTAPNAMLVAFMQEEYEKQIDFAHWMMVGLPLAAVMLPLAWIALTRFVFKVDFKTSDESRAELRRMKNEMGSIKTPEKRVAIVFVLMAIAWVTRPLLTVSCPVLRRWTTPALLSPAPSLLFLIPSGDKSDPILIRWKYAEQLPMSVLILFGGGLTLAAAVSRTGLAEWIGNNLQAVTDWPVIAIVIAAAAMIIFLTELTSNIATTATFLPVVAAVAVKAGIDPIVLTVPVTFAASCAFMLPVATPPNAIVFGSGLLTVPKMARAGLALNFVGIIVVSIAAITLAPRFLS